MPSLLWRGQGVLISTGSPSGYHQSNSPSSTTSPPPNSKSSFPTTVGHDMSTPRLILPPNPPNHTLAVE
eukprot:4113493-Karenia_brevis.AAC.1